MKRLRFTIGGLVVVIFFVALAIAALRASTDLWENAVFSTTLLLLATAILLVVHRSGRKRAFWLGFAVFGSAYLAASVIPPVESRLLTTQGLSYLDSKLPARNRLSTVQFFTSSTVTSSTIPTTYQALSTPVAVQPSGSNALPWRFVSPAGPATALIWGSTSRLFGGSSGTTENFLKIGHCVFALVFAFAGGRFSRFLFRPAVNEVVAPAESLNNGAARPAEVPSEGETPQ